MGLEVNMFKPDATFYLSLFN